MPSNAYTTNIEQQILLTQNQAYLQQIGLTQPEITNNNNSNYHYKYQEDQNIWILNQPIPQPKNISQFFIIQKNLQQNPQIFLNVQKGIQPNQINQNYKNVNP